MKRRDKIITRPRPSVGPMILWLTGFLSLFPIPAPAEETMELSAGIHLIQAEVANTGESRSMGLMHRKSMSRNHGMLFVFERVARHCMWMHNTLLPLSVAFLDEQGRILNVEDMQPQTDDSHCAAQPARFALEMNADWFRSRGLAPGMPIRGIDKAPRGL